MDNGHKMVRLETGEYAIRKFDGTEYKYMDLNAPYWWTRDSCYFKDCVGTFKLISYRYNFLFAEEKEVDPKTGLPFDEIPEPSPVPKSKLSELKITILDFIRSLQ